MYIPLGMEKENDLPGTVSVSYLAQHSHPNAQVFHV